MKTLIARRYLIYSRILLAARLLSVVSILLLVMFVIGEGFDLEKITNRDITGLIFFPIGVAAGFIVAWKWETAGGLISLISLFCFYLVFGFLLSDRIPRGFSFLIFTTPALIFLAGGIYGRMTIASHRASTDQYDESGS